MRIRERLRLGGRQLELKVCSFLNKVFEGNTDQFLVVSHLLKNPINVTRYIRIYPVAWNKGISLRADFYGCKSGTLD